MHKGYAHNWRIVRVFGKQHYLLISLVAMLVLLPLLTAEDSSRFWLSAMLTIILVAGPLSIATRRIGFYIALVLGAMATINSWFGNALGSSPLKMIGNIATVSVFLLMAVQIFRVYLFSRDDITGETLIAAINAYICIGITYAFAYSFLLTINPEAFSFPTADPVNFNTCVYLSFVTMTTLGYGDITPVSEFGMILTWTEALTGQLFIALTVARIVGIMVAKESS
jgi:voltage-gated potassium channel